MTVKELIEKLQRFDTNLTVIYQTGEDNYEPSPVLRVLDFDTSYWDIHINIVKLPANMGHIVL